jgi:hypothetical protein
MLLDKLDTQLANFRKLDPLRTQRGAEGMTDAQWRIWMLEEGEKYAQEHLGEHVQTVTCPNHECKHYRTPFVVHGQKPHWAFDFAAGPDVIWNTEISELVHMHYCKAQSCEHVAHRKQYTGSLSLQDAAKILRISPFAILFAFYERKFDPGFNCDLDLLDNVEKLAAYID